MVTDQEYVWNEQKETKSEKKNDFQGVLNMNARTDLNYERIDVFKTNVSSKKKKK